MRKRPAGEDGDGVEEAQGFWEMGGMQLAIKAVVGSENKWKG